MKITIYELLGLIKDGNRNEIPEKIKFHDSIFNFNFFDWKYFNENK